jgi:hypothetical protein
LQVFFLLLGGFLIISWTSSKVNLASTSLLNSFLFSFGYNRTSQRLFNQILPLNLCKFHILFLSLSMVSGQIIKIIFLLSKCHSI